MGKIVKDLVIELQALLGLLGYLHHDPTGNFTDATIAALEQFSQEASTEKPSISLGSPVLLKVHNRGLDPQTLDDLRRKLDHAQADLCTLGFLTEASPRAAPGAFRAAVAKWQEEDRQGVVDGSLSLPLCAVLHAQAAARP